VWGEGKSRSLRWLRAAPTALAIPFPVDPALTGWANVWRAYGAGE
jgi:hypothetical protein